MKISLRECIGAVKGDLILGDPRVDLRRAVVDSRFVTSGDIFFALKGERTDGHDYGMTACRSGASAVVVDRLDWLQKDTSFQAGVIQVKNVLAALQDLGHFLRKRFSGPVIGITGSNGKTTTKQMLASILKNKEPGLFTQGNYNSQIGMPLVLSLLEKEHQWIVLEMGASAPGHIALLADIALPTHGVLTSLGPAHLETFGSLSHIARTKWELMNALPSDGCAIVPWNEKLLEPHIRTYTKKIIFFGFDSNCPIRASQIETSEKVSFMLDIPGHCKKVTLPISGECNVSNALAAAAAAWVLNTSFDHIVQGLESFEPPTMRMQVIQHPSGAVFLNDAYNANPSSTQQAIKTLFVSYPKKKKILVLGSMLELGTETEKYHLELGAFINEFSFDRVVFIGDEAKFMQKGFLVAGGGQDRATWVDSHEQAAFVLKPLLSSDVVVLFKASRGIQLEKVVTLLMKN